jgi:small-conductance mechanosensitive channel
VDDDGGTWADPVAGADALRLRSVSAASRWLVLAALALSIISIRAAEPEQAAPGDSRAVLSAEQVIQMLDETVDWYRMLGTQQQAATQPSELLMLYANRQATDSVIALVFDVAHASAELLSSQETAAQEQQQDPEQQQQESGQEQAAASGSRATVRARLDAQHDELQAQIKAAKAALPATQGRELRRQQVQIEVLQGELDMVDARRNMLVSMSQFEQQSDAEGFGANALKAHIDAIAATIPKAGAESPQAGTMTPETPEQVLQDQQRGIWSLAASVMRLRAKLRTIDAMNTRTVQLQQMFEQMRAPAQQRLRELAAQAEALSEQSPEATTRSLRSVRDQYDTLAWLFNHTSALVTPLRKTDLLLNQYRRNLDNWSDQTQRQLTDAWQALLTRVVVFVGLLALVLGVAHLWERLVYRYVQDGRLRARHMLLRRILLWVLVIVIAVSMFATEIGSLATFAGLITAGLAVALQSVLVSIVGYFFLVGRYGVRVGDRVQIGNVIGEVADLGLVRLHLMELKGEGAKVTPTGRVVAFANSVVFQASGGLFKQIRGIDLSWHVITLVLPRESDHGHMKQRLIDAANAVLREYQDDFLRQAQTMQRDSSALNAGDVRPQVQLRFSAANVEAMVRYPVTSQTAAEIDERISRELLAVVASGDSPTTAASMA